MLSASEWSEPIDFDRYRFMKSLIKEIHQQQCLKLDTSQYIIMNNVI